MSVKDCLQPDYKPLFEMEMLGTYPLSVKTKSFIHHTWPDKTKNQWIAISYLPCLYFSQFCRIGIGIISVCLEKGKTKTGHDEAVIIRITGCRWGRTNFLSYPFHIIKTP